MFLFFLQKRVYQEPHWVHRQKTGRWGEVFLPKPGLSLVLRGPIRLAKPPPARVGAQPAGTAPSPDTVTVPVNHRVLPVSGTFLSPSKG